MAKSAGQNVLILLTWCASSPYCMLQNRLLWIRVHVLLPFSAPVMLGCLLSHTAHFCGDSDFDWLLLTCVSASEHKAQLVIKQKHLQTLKLAHCVQFVVYNHENKTFEVTIFINKNIFFSLFI
jgi:hypothetical protein